MTRAEKDSPPLGLGWRIDADEKARPRWHHGGATPGGCCLLTIYPETGLSIAIAGNVMAMRLALPKAVSEFADIFARGRT